MTQAFNLSQVANKVDSSGKLDGSTALNGTLPIANGGTNNSSLAVTAGGIAYTDGSKLVNSGAGTADQYLISNASSAPTWQTVLPSANIFLGTLTPTSGSTSATISGLNLTNYKWVDVAVAGQASLSTSTQSINIGTSSFFAPSTGTTGQLTWGIISLDLIYGFVNSGWNTKSLFGITRYAHGYTTSSTSITLTTTGITFNTAPFYFWGRT